MHVAAHVVAWFAQPLPYGTREPALKCTLSAWGADCHVAIPSCRLEASIDPACARLFVRGSQWLPVACPVLACWLAGGRLAALLSHTMPPLSRGPLAAPTVCVGASMRNDIARPRDAFPQVKSSETALTALP